MKRKLMCVALAVVCALTLWGGGLLSKDAYAAGSSIDTPVEIYQGKYDDYTERDEIQSVDTSQVDSFDISFYKDEIYPQFTSKNRKTKYSI